MAQGSMRSVNLTVQVDVVDDTTPQLGGSLDVNGNKIVSVSNGDIDIEPNGTGNVLLGNITIDADQTVGAGQDNYVMTYDNGTGLVSLEATASTVAELVDLSDVVTAANTDKFALMANGTTGYVGRALVEADISDFGTYSPTSHTHVLAAGATDVTATAAELNLLDLSGLTAGWVLSADSATTASWKAAAGGGGGDVTKVGTPANNQVGVWTGDGTIEGASDLTWDGTTLIVNGGDITVRDSAAYLTLTDSNASGATSGSSRLRFAYSGSDTVTQQIYTSSGDLYYNNTAGKHIITTGDAAGTSDNRLRVDGSVQVRNELIIGEQADHASTVAAAYGFIWVKTATPNVLQFTDDAGTDWRLNGFEASTTALASLNVPHGAAPTTPVDGDIWTTTAGLYVRINGSTVGPLS